MGTCTLMLAFQLTENATQEDVWQLVPDILSIMLSDATIVYPGNGERAREGNLVIAVANEGRSHATLSYHDNGLLTIDVQHECSKEELEPMHGPYTLEYIRTKETKIETLLGEIFERSVSLYTPIRRNSEGPRNYSELGDERLLETDYDRAVYDVTSPYQRVCIMQSRQFGHVLTLDDDVMFGESDEIYVTTVLGLDRGNTFDGATVLILGGGDGGLLHTLTSLPKPPRHVLMAEIDEEVMKACRQHMRSICGDVLDNYQTSRYTIVVRDCLEVLKESAEKGEKYDYVVNDLTEFSVNKDQYGFSYDFKTNNIVMELSFRCLKDGGKYLARGNCSSATPYVEKIERELTQMGFPFKRFDRHVPSFAELYCFFEAEKVVPGTKTAQH